MSGDQTGVAVVTGSAAPRVGRAIAARLHRDGYRVALHGRSSADSARSVARAWSETGPETEVFRADVSREIEVDRFADQVFERFGRVDLLVHTAAAWNPVPLEQAGEAQLDEFYASNLKSTYLTCRAFGLRCCAQAHGSALVLIGDAGLQRPYLNFAPYFATKGSTGTMVRLFAKEFASRHSGVRVLGIHPGPLVVDGETRQHLIARAGQGILTGQAGTDADLADAVVALAGLRFATGAEFTLDGGRLLVAGDESSESPEAQ